MAFEWSKYLARYPRQRGGWFFGTGDDAYDGQLILDREGEPPVIVWYATEWQGRFVNWKLCARTAVKLNGNYELSIRPCSMLSGAVNSAKGLVGLEDDLGFPEVLRGRSVTTNNGSFTQRVLRDADLRACLQARKWDYLSIQPMPQAEGWHLVEIGATGLEGKNKDWWCKAMRVDIGLVSLEEKEIVYQAISEHYNEQMDAFVRFLRTSVRAVTTWRM